MKNLMTILLIFFICFFEASPLAAQQPVPHSKWSVSQALDLGTGRTIAYHGTFVVTDSEVRWQQRNQAVDYVFIVTGSSGTWPDLTADGTAALNVVFRGQPGTVTFSRTGGVAQIRVRINASGGEIFPFQFIADAIQKS